MKILFLNSCIRSLGILKKKKEKTYFSLPKVSLTFAWNELCGKRKRVWVLLGTDLLKHHESVSEMWVSTVFSSESIPVRQMFFFYFNLIQSLFRASVSRLVAPSEGDCGSKRTWTNIWKYFMRNLWYLSFLQTRRTLWLTGLWQMSLYLLWFVFFSR